MRTDYLILGVDDTGEVRSMAECGSESWPRPEMLVIVPGHMPRKTAARLLALLAAEVRSSAPVH